MSKKAKLINNADDTVSPLMITANFSGSVRHDQMEGREFLVAPMVMMVEGVHSGSDGPIFYSSAELSKFPAVWNQKPVVVYHPEYNGQAVSACDPEILSNRKVGTIMNTTFEDGKLKAEAWLEVDRMEAVDDRISNAIENKEMMELSIGVFSETTIEEGEWNGESYIGIAKNLRADHLALLPDKLGACSIEDGAGFMRVNNKTLVFDISKMDDEQVKHLEDHSKAVSKQLLSIATNAISHGDVYSLISSWVYDNNNNDGWIEEVYDDYFIYVLDGQYIKQNYSVNDNELTIIGEPINVTKEIAYKIVNSRKELEMTKKELVDNLIQNEITKFEEGDREFLMKLGEENLEKMTPVVVDNKVTENEKAVIKAAEDAADKALTNNEDKNTKPVTASEYIKKAPAEIASMLQNGLDSYNAEKAQVTAVILSNEKNLFTVDQLNAKEMTELKQLAALAATKENPIPVNHNYSGNGPLPTDNVEEELLEMPVINYGKEEKVA